MEIPYPAILAVYNQASSWTQIMINHHDNDDVTMKKQYEVCHQNIKFASTLSEGPDTTIDVSPTEKISIISSSSPRTPALTFGHAFKHKTAKTMLFGEEEPEAILYEE